MPPERPPDESSPAGTSPEPSRRSTEPPRASERRQATVLFADISGFTAMSEKLDPEEVTDVTNRCFKALDTIVAAHGGHVDKYIGDCIMALFGVPTALERAPREAVNAAIEMRSRLAELNRETRLPARLDLHIGINTGLVIAGQVGGDVKQEFTVMGDAVNIASRLKDAAPNGSIWIGPDTWREVRDDFRLEKLAPLALKGKEKTVDAWAVLSTEPAQRPRVGRGDVGVGSALVGRDAEIALLRACIAAVTRGQGGIAHVIGEAGLGKSRLVAEACGLEEARAVRVLEGRSLPIGARGSFHPFTEILRQWAGIEAGDDEERARAKLEAAMEALCGADEAAQIFPLVATLMGLRLAGAHAGRVEGIAGDALELLIQRSVRELLERLAAVQPLVLVFEDLHWADQSSIRLLESLLRVVPGTPILFVFAFRPDHAESSERILAATRERHAGRQVEIQLAPLDTRHCEALVRGLLGGEDLPFSVLATVSKTSEGNPFYIEEVVRGLMDEGLVTRGRTGLQVSDRIESVVIPGTIQGVIMARVDRLRESARHLLQVASVLGRSFYHRILVQIVPPGTDVDGELAYLAERQLIFERRTRRTASLRRSTLAEEVEWVFKHALVQDTVYAALLQKTRRELHARAARAVEASFADRLPDFSGMLAYHFSRAEDLAKAEEYLFKAGDEAARAAASSEALTFFQEASKLYLLLNAEGGDPRKHALLERNIALALLNKGELTESIAHFDRALQILGEHVPQRPLAVGARFAADLAAVLYHVYFRAGRHGRAADDREREIVELYFHRGRAETTSDPRRVFLQLPTGLRKLNRLDPRQIDQACGMYVSCAGLFAYSGISFAISERMLRIAKGLVRDGNVIDEFIYRAVQFYHHYLRGDWSEQWTLDGELVEQDLRYGQLWDVTSYLGLDADRRLRRGDFAGARRQLATLGEVNDGYGYGFAGTTRTGMETVLLLEERRLDAALRSADTYLAGRPEEALRVFGLGLVAKVHALEGALEPAAAALARAEQILRRTSVVSPWHQTTYLVGRLLHDAAALEAAARGGDGAARGPLARAARQSARRALAVARRVAKERVETWRLAGTVAWLLGRRRQALRCWNESLAWGERLGARPELARTHLELGRRLGGTSLAGADGAGHRARAETLLAELGLSWDLERLRGADAPDAGTAAAGAR